MLYLFFSLLVLCCLQQTALSYIEADNVTYLPGWDGPLPSAQFSGLLQVPNTNPTRYYHYWLVTSEKDPANDPIVFWFNGGPGASSLLGYFTEQGPFNLNEDSIKENTTSVPVLFYNNYTWAKIVNIVFLESPAGVGFSYCDGSEGPIESCPNWNDTNVAQDNHAILQQFFLYYPEYLKNDFYIIGESYAGIYVPTLVMQIESNSTGLPKLKGFAVGDGCMGVDSMGGCGLDFQATFFEVMYGHGQLSQANYNKLWKECGNSLIYGNYSNLANCTLQINISQTALGGYNVYNIYDECYLKNDDMMKSSNKNLKRSSFPVFLNDKGHVRFNLKQAFNGARYHENLKSGINEYKCGGATVTGIYLNNDLVKEAIHVANIPWTWQDGNWAKYTSTQTDLRPYYKTWVQEGLYKILIYYGDVDSAVPYIGGEEWTSQLGFPILESWRPWTTNDKTLMGGYVQIYESAKNFTYLTVRGAGHQVPQYKPPQALKMLECWIHGKPYPIYNASYLDD